MKKLTKDHKIYFDILFEEDGLKAPDTSILKEADKYSPAHQAQRVEVEKHAQGAVNQIKAKYAADLEKLKAGLERNPGDTNLLAKQKEVLHARQIELNNIAKETSVKMSNVERNVLGATTKRTADTTAMLSGQAARPKEADKILSKYKVSTKTRGAKTPPIDWGKYKKYGKKYGLPALGLYAAWRLTRPSEPQYQPQYED